MARTRSCSGSHLILSFARANTISFIRAMYDRRMSSLFDDRLIVPVKDRAASEYEDLSLQERDLQSSVRSLKDDLSRANAAASSVNGVRCASLSSFRHLADRGQIDWRNVATTVVPSWRATSPTGTTATPPSFGSRPPLNWTVFASRSIGSRDRCRSARATISDSRKSRTSSGSLAPWAPARTLLIVA